MNFSRRPCALPTAWSRECRQCLRAKHGSHGSYASHPLRTEPQHGAVFFFLFLITCDICRAALQYLFCFEEDECLLNNYPNKKTICRNLFFVVAKYRRHLWTNNQTKIVFWSDFRFLLYFGQEILWCLLNPDIRRVASESGFYCRTDNVQTFAHVVMQVVHRWLTCPMFPNATSN